MKLLVLCSENSCRSQIAEGYLKYYTKGKIEVFSAGIKGKSIHPMAVKVMEEDGIDITCQHSNDYDEYVEKVFDHLITVCPEAKKQLPQSLKFLNIIHFEIPDPAKFSGTEEDKLTVFRNVRELIKKHMLKFIGKEVNHLDPAPY